MTESETAWLHFTMLLASELGDGEFARYFVKDDLSTIWFWTNFVVTLPLFYVEGSLPYQFILHVISWMVAGVLTLLLKALRSRRCRFMDLLLSNDNVYGPVSCSIGGIVQYTSSIVCFMSRSACRCARLPYSVQAVSFAVGVPIVNRISIWSTFRLLFAAWLIFWLVVRIAHMYVGRHQRHGRSHFSLRMRSAEGLCKINDARRLLLEKLFYTFSGSPLMSIAMFNETRHPNGSHCRLRNRCAEMFSTMRWAARAVVCGLVCSAICWLVIRAHPLKDVDCTYYYELRYTLISICVPAVLILLTNTFVANSVWITSYIYERVYDFVSGEGTAFQEMQRDLHSRIDRKNHQRGLA